jgi:hypothetical protein
MSLNLLDQELAALKPSKPIFKLKLESRWGGEDKYVKFDPTSIGSYRGNDNTPIGRLVKEHFREGFSEGKYSIDTKNIKAQCVQSIREMFTDYLEQHSQNKNPKQTDVYRWYALAAYASKYTEGFITSSINLYAYIANKKAMILNDKDIAGIIAALEVLYNKHKNDFPDEYSYRLERRTRRRRRRW